MTLQQLEYIIAVDKLRNFTKAADYCRVTQPTLSAMIQKLEEELGVKIFDRNQQPICPTVIGNIVIKQAHEVLLQANHIKEIIAEEKSSLGGSFKLGILPTIAPYLLPRFVPLLAKKYPHLDIRMAEMKTSEIKAALLSGDIDAGILADLDGLSDYSKESLFYEQFYAYVSKESALSGNNVVRTSDLANEQLWLLDEGHCFRDQMVKFCQLKSAKASQIAYNLGSMETFMRMVESCKGVTFIPELAVLQLSESQRQLAHEFAIPKPTRHIIMLTNKNYIRQQLISAIAHEIKQSVPKSMLSLRANQVSI
ncbi:MAG: LysR family transcriptional regulator [Muribaculaceae bacterium]|nr:LysR family transcriptional regulator [Muribaculaceae bacterium]